MIKKIILDLSGQQIELSLEQAEDLYNDLKKVFDKQLTYIPYPNYPYTYPHVWYLANTPYVASSSGKSYSISYTNS